MSKSPQSQRLELFAMCGAVGLSVGAAGFGVVWGAWSWWFVAAEPEVCAFFSWKYARLEGRASVWIGGWYFLPPLAWAAVMALEGRTVHAWLFSTFAITNLIVWWFISCNGVRKWKEFNTAGRCEQCGYDLSGALPDQLCPECGAAQT